MTSKDDRVKAHKAVDKTKGAVPVVVGEVKSGSPPSGLTEKNKGHQSSGKSKKK